MGVVKYGQIRGPEVNLPFEVAASVVFKHLGGAWMMKRTDGRIQIATAASTAIIGWAFAGDFTASSTAGNTKISVNTSKDATFEMPLDTALTEAQLLALVGEFHDIVVTDNIQYCDHDATTTNVLEIVGYRYYGSALGQQTVEVKIVPKNLTLPV